VSAFAALFLTGLLQVFLVATNTRQISQGRLIGSYLVGFGISAVWAYNVHHVAISGLWGGFWYAQGAACGTLLGIVVTRWWYGE
jgi:hypothetical protein